LLFLKTNHPNFSISLKISFRCSAVKSQSETIIFESVAFLPVTRAIDKIMGGDDITQDDFVNLLLIEIQMSQPTFAKKVYRIILDKG
jgi:hypothetical protein